MGLDLYIYSQKKKDDSNKGIGLLKIKELLETLNESNNPELIDLLDRLYILSQNRGDSYTEHLSKALQQYLESENYYPKQSELAYFRNVWCLLRYFYYTEDNYAKDKPLSKEQLQELKDHIEKILIKACSVVPKMYLRNENNSFIPLNDYCYSQKTLDKINSVCQKEFSKEIEYKELTYNKLLEIYNKIAEILRYTDFEEEDLVINADW